MLVIKVHWYSSVYEEFEALIGPLITTGRSHAAVIVHYCFSTNRYGSLLCGVCNPWDVCVPYVFV